MTSEKESYRGLAKDELLHMQVLMLRIRAFENKVFELLTRDVLQGASHVSAGQEATAVGATCALAKQDLLTSTHRGHGHCVARGGDLKLMLAELCGKASGYCKGKGGSMHIADVTAGNLGATGIVAGNIPVATGAAMACQMQKTDQVCLCFFGDGASNNGTFHESLNMAGLWKLPVVYVCENNLYGMSVSTKRACAVGDVASRASAYNMPGVIVDGQQVLDVRETVLEAVARARSGEGATLVEAKTYRYRGHSRSDARVYRTKEEEAFWHDRDPLDLFRKELVDAGVATEDEMTTLHKQVEQEMADAEHFALEESDYPDPSELYEDVFVDWIQGERGLKRI